MDPRHDISFAVAVPGQLRVRVRQALERAVAESRELFPEGADVSLTHQISSSSLCSGMENGHPCPDVPSDGTVFATASGASVPVLSVFAVESDADACLAFRGVSALSLVNRSASSVVVVSDGRYGEMFNHLLLTEPVAGMGGRREGRQWGAVYLNGTSLLMGADAASPELLQRAVVAAVRNLLSA